MVAIMATCTASQEEAQRPNTILTSQSSQVCYAPRPAESFHTVCSKLMRRHAWPAG